MPKIAEDLKVTEKKPSLLTNQEGFVNEWVTLSVELLG